jgi:hypothetical protein
MGSDLKPATGRATGFIVMASKDPKSGERKVNPKAGKLPPVGDTVDAARGDHTNSIDAALQYPRCRQIRPSRPGGLAGRHPGARLDATDRVHADGVIVAFTAGGRPASAGHFRV